MGIKDSLELVKIKDRYKQLEKRSGKTQYVSNSRSVNVKCIYCDNSAFDTTRKLCRTHYIKLKKQGGLTQLQLTNNSRSVKNRGVCIVEGCESSGKIEGLCGMHYRRLGKLRVIRM